MKKLFIFALIDFKVATFDQIVKLVDNNFGRFYFHFSEPSTFQVPLSSNSLYFSQIKDLLADREECRKDLVNKLIGQTNILIKNLKINWRNRVANGINEINTEYLTDLKKNIIYLENLLTALLFLPGNTLSMREIGKVWLRQFIEVLTEIRNTILQFSRQLNHQIAGQCYLLVYHPIERIYLIDELMAKYWGTSLRLIEEFELCLYLVESNVFISEYPSLIKHLFIDELEKLLFACSETLPKKNNKDSQDLQIYFKYLSFCIYFTKGNYDNALAIYRDQSVHILEFIKKSYHKISDKIITFHFYEKILVCLKYALQKQLFSSKWLFSKTNELKLILNFQLLHQQQFSSLFKQFHQADLNLTELCQKNLIEEMLLEVDQFLKECKPSPKKRVIAKSQNLKNHFEYPPAMLPPLKKTTTPIAIEIPTTTVTIDDQKKEQDKLVRHHRWSKKQKKQKKVHSSQPSPTTPISDPLISPIYTLFNPISHSPFNAQIYFHAVAHIFSNEMINTIKKIAAKGTIGLTFGHYKPLGVLEQASFLRQNLKVKWKLKCKIDRTILECYGIEDIKKTTFRIWDLDPHKGSTDKFHDQKFDKYSLHDFSVR